MCVDHASSPKITTSMMLFQTPPFDQLASRIARYVRAFWPSAVVLDETPDRELPANLADGISLELPVYFTIAEDPHTATEIYPKVVTGAIPPTYGLITCRLERSSAHAQSASLIVTSHKRDARIVDSFWRLEGLAPLDTASFDRMLAWLREGTDLH